jgi:cell division protein FtsA
MKSNQIITAVDLGTTKISAIVASISEENKLKVLGFGESPTYGIENGLMKDINKATESIKKAIEQAEGASDEKATNIYVGISGEHIKSTNATSRLAITEPDDAELGEINKNHIDSVVNLAKEMVITQLNDPKLKVIHTIPQYFDVDNQSNIINPINMSGKILTAHVHVIMADSAAMRNIDKCFELAGYRIEKMIFESLASSKAVLDNDETYLGCILLDIGGGTTDIAAFFKETIRFSNVVPLGGANITSDIRSGLSTTPKYAEKLKMTLGDIFPEEIPEEDLLEVEGIGGRSEQPTKRKYLVTIIESRMREILEIAYKTLISTNYQDFMSAGIILTGGSSLLTNISHLTQNVFNMSSRVGYPNLERLEGNIGALHDPRYSTVVGLLYYAMDTYMVQEDTPKYQKKNNKAKINRGKLFQSVKDYLKDFL